jgi:diaminopimelate dehydrogenase
MDRDHSGIPHGGNVIRTGKTGVDNCNSHMVEFRIQLDSNPEFTASVLTAYARAAYKLSKEGSVGAKTIFDVAPGYLSPKTPEELRATLL